MLAPPHRLQRLRHLHATARWGPLLLGRFVGHAPSQCFLSRPRVSRVRAWSGYVDVRFWGLVSFFVKITSSRLVSRRRLRNLKGWDFRRRFLSLGHFQYRQNPALSNTYQAKSLAMMNGRKNEWGRVSTIEAFDLVALWPEPKLQHMWLQQIFGFMFLWWEGSGNKADMKFKFFIPGHRNRPNLALVWDAIFFLKGFAFLRFINQFYILHSHWKKFLRLSLVAA